MEKMYFCGISEYCGYQNEIDMVQHDKIMYELGYKKAIENFKNLITERLKQACNMTSCNDCEECCEVSALLRIEKQLNCETFTV